MAEFDRRFDDRRCPVRAARNDQRDVKRGMADRELMAQRDSGIQ